MVDLAERLHVTHEQIASFCKQHHIVRLALFGSVTRDDFRPDSDVDVLYEFKDGHRIGWDVVLVKEELERLLGRTVDFIPLKYVNAHLKDRILQSARDVYVAA